MKKWMLIIIIVLLLILAGIGMYFLIPNMSSGKNENTSVSNTIRPNDYENISKNTVNSVLPDEYDYYKTPEGYEEYQKLIQKRTIDKVTMALKEGTLTKTGATFVITDKNEAPYIYGEEFWIEQNKDNKWERLLAEETIVKALAWYVGKDGKIEFKIDWSTMYGELQQGKYRFVKKAGNQTIYAEFTIE